MKARVLVAALVALMLVWLGREAWLRAAVAPAGDVEAWVRVGETVDVEGPVWLEFDGLDGSLSVRPGAPGKLEIVAIKTAYGTSAEEAAARARELPLVIRREGDRVLFSARSEEVPFWQSPPPLRVDYQITAPEQAGLKVSDGKGSVHASGLHRGVDLSGGDLTVRLSNVRGGASVAVERGNITIDGSDGDLRLRTTAGEIGMTHASGGEVECDAGGGVSVAESEVARRLSVRSGGNAVSLRRTHAASVEVVAADAASIDLSDASAAQTLLVRGGVGAISVERTQAHPLVVVSERAAVDLKEVQGDVEVATAGEPVTLVGASPSSLSVASNGGDVYFAGSLPAAGTTAIDSGGGELRLSVAREATLDLDADAGGGELAVDRRLLAGEEVGGSVARMAINGGGPKVVLRTHGGALHLTTR